MFATSNFGRNVIGAFGATVIAASCLTVAAVPAAATETSVATKTVSYADLNLNSTQGRAQLDARIRAAAKSVCEVQAPNLAARVSQGRCIATAIRKANAS